MYKWLIDTIHGRQGEWFRINKLKAPYIITSNGFEVFNIYHGTFHKYIEGVHFETVDSIIDNDLLQFKFDFL
jgi:hypothetical protein